MDLFRSRRKGEVAFLRDKQELSGGELPPDVLLLDALELLLLRERRRERAFPNLRIVCVVGGEC